SKDPQTDLLPSAGTYRQVYPSGIEIYGASVSASLGASTLGGEISVRRNMPLVSGPVIVPQSLGPNTSPALFAAGDTLQGQLSSVTAFARSPWWARAEFKQEIAFNGRLTIARNNGALAPGRTSFAAEYEASFEPEYFEVLPALDVSIPLGFSFALSGKSS